MVDVRGFEPLASSVRGKYRVTAGGTGRKARSARCARARQLRCVSNFPVVCLARSGFRAK